MKIFNTKVYALEESLIRSGYAMQTEILDMNEAIYQDTYCSKPYECGGRYRKSEDRMSFKRGFKLGNIGAGSGDDCFLKGIIVQADCEFPQYLWQQAKRYHWFDIISSQSTMHSILKMDLDEMYNSRIDHRIKDITKEYIEIYRQYPTPENFENILANVGQGLELTAGVSTNYLQLKTMYYQREFHLLPCWKVFKDWCNSLPYFKELCLRGKMGIKIDEKEVI